MAPAIDLRSVLMVVGFVLLVGMSVWHRARVQRAVAALPDDVRLRLGWIWTGEISDRQHRRLMARRLLVRGLPDWVPISGAARRDLFWHRAFGLAAAVYLFGVMPAVWGALALVPMLLVPIVAVIAVQSWFDGPWGDGPWSDGPGDGGA